MSTGNGGGPETIGLLHPGEMGAAVGAALRAGGHRVLWASAGRSPATARRAAGAQLEDAVTIAALATQSDVILSIVPPAEALTVAAALPRFAGLYLDANATSPQTAGAVARTIAAAGGRCVDGSIIGGPPVTDGDVRVYLSGPEAQRAAALFEGTIVAARVAGPQIGDASAVKVAYAGWTKGSAALLLAVREYAARAGVEATVLAEWAQSIPGLEARWERASDAALHKGWRWAGEMREIAAALEAAGLPPGFHQGAAEIYAASERPASD